MNTRARVCVGVCVWCEALGSFDFVGSLAKRVRACLAMGYRIDERGKECARLDVIYNVSIRIIHT